MLGGFLQWRSGHRAADGLSQRPESKSRASIPVPHGVQLLVIVFGFSLTAVSSAHTGKEGRSSSGLGSSRCPSQVVRTVHLTTDVLAHLGKRLDLRGAWAELGWAFQSFPRIRMKWLSTR